MTEQLTLIDKPDIKLIVIDVDNTLLNSQHKLSERNEQTIKAAIAQGTRVMLATGKTYGACKDLIERLGIKEPGIFTQGLTIHNANGTLRHQQILDTEIVRQVVTFAEDRGFAVALYAQGRLLARSKTPYLEELHEKWGDSKPEYMGPLQNILPTIEVNKVVALSAYDERKAKALRWQLNAQMDGRARLMNGGVPHMIEVLPPGASKGTALKSLLREL
ncbi:MAG: HAD-IIB family hydrolase, partial [Chloroflexota bacterium]